MIQIDINEFIYSKTSHTNILKDFFYENNIKYKFIDKNVSYINEFQELLTIYLIRNLVPRNSRILGIDKESYNVLQCLKYDYDCYILSSTDILNNDIIKSPESIYVSRIEKPEVRKYDNYGYFEYIFSISGSKNINTNFSFNEFVNLFFNLNWMAKPGGYINFHLNINFKDGDIVFSPILYFFYKDIFKSYQAAVNFYNPSKVSLDNVLLKFPEIQIKYAINENTVSDKMIGSFSYNVLLKKNPTAIALKTELSPKKYLKDKPAYFFHHLIKCGGSSLGVVLGKWFQFENDLYDKVDGALGYDYGGNVNNFKKYKFNLENISSDTCIRGHFQHEGIFIHQRYPEIFTRPDEFKVFTFVRDPMKVLYSLYYFGKKRDYDYQTISLETYLKTTNNFLAYLLNCDDSNYKEILDRYFFIGIVDRMQESFDKLASMIGKRRIQVPVYNTTEKDSQIADLSPEFIEKIKEQNELDYKIYNYCLEKFNKL